MEVPYVTSCPSVSLVGLSVGWSVDLSENSLKGGELHFHASNGSATGSFLACCFATREKTFSLAAALIDWMLEEDEEEEEEREIRTKLYKIPWSSMEIMRSKYRPSNQ